MSENFIPPYPTPHKNKLSLFKRFFSSWGSWIHTLFERSYTMKMGEVRLPRLNFYIANEPPLVKRILEDEPDSFPKHHLLHEMLEPLIGDSVFTTNGEVWAHHREMMNPSFTHTNLQRAFPTMGAAVRELLGRIEAQDMTQPITIDPLMTHVTADIIFRTLLSKTLSDDEAEQVYRAFSAYQKDVQSSTILRIYNLPLLGYRRRLARAARHIHEVFEPPIRARYEEFYNTPEPPAHADIMDSLLRAKHPVTGKGFTLKELIDQIALIFLAGHETSASALTWSLYLLAKCPHLQEQLYEEINSQCGSGDITPATLRNLTLIRDVFRETLRLYPPISFFMRETIKGTDMRDKHMKKGSLVVISPWLIQRNKNHFPCPHAFKPERFRDEAQQDACKNAYLPFGRGQRICIGAGFAQQEAALVLAHIVRKFTLSFAGEHEPEAISQLTLRPKEGIRLRFMRREKKS